MNDESYQPIACGEYDIYEIAIMRRCEINLEWVISSGELLRKRVRPMELKIIDGAEYLLIIPNEHIAGEAEIQAIRLDKIKHVEILNK